MKKRIKWVIKLAFTISLFILIFNPKFFGIQKQFIPVTLVGLWNEVTGINLSVFFQWILIAMAIKALGMFSSMLRWDLLLKGQAIKLPFSHLMGTFLVGRFFGMFLPSTIGLDGYRLYDVAKHTGKVVESTTVIIIEKLIGFIALTSLVFMTLPLGLRFLPIQLPILAMILSVLAGFILCSFLLLFNPRIIQILIAILPIPGRKKIQGKLEKIARAVSAYSGQKILLAKALVLGFFVHLCTALMYFGTAMAIKTINIHILDILFTSPLMIYGTVIGPSIGGEGIREIIFALILGAKVGTAKTILFAHLGFWIGEILSLAGGIIYIIRPAEYRPKSEEMKEVLQASQETASKKELTMEELNIVKTNVRQAMWAGIIMGIWAGFIIGILESFAIIFSFSNFSEKTVLYWGPITYGILGGLLGFGFGFVSCGYLLFKTRRFAAEKLWAISFASVFIPLAFVITRFHIIRNLLHERPLTVLENIGFLAFFTLLFLFFYWLSSKLLRNNIFKIFVQGYGAPIIWAVFLVFCFSLNIWNYYFDRESGDSWKASPFKPSPNVIFIVADALRADHLSAYGYNKNHTSNIDGLAEDGILFTHHFAQSSWTKPQTATLLTSLYPSTHNTYLKPHVLPGEIETLAEVLQAMGYRTGGIVSNINLSPIFNFHQGFYDYYYLSPDYFFYAEESSSNLSLYNLMRLIRERLLFKKKYVYHYYQDAAVVNERAFTWLGKVKDAPFFLYLHYMDPHDPYFAHPYNGEAVARVSEPNPPAEWAERMRELYDQDISYFDDKFGEFLKFLKDNKIYDNTLIIFTSDHGEEFYDHGGWWHGTALFDEQIHIPLIIKLSRSKKKGTIDTRLVRSLDIAPTIIDTACGTIPKSMQGKGLMTEKDTKERIVFSEEDHENNVIKSLRSNRWKLILTQEGSPRMHSPIQLFDIKNDPGEKKNVAINYPGILKDLQNRIDNITYRIRIDAYKAEEGVIDQATQERLKALGYVE